jgi:predicted permease
VFDAFRAIPGVEAVGAATWAPFSSAGAGFIDIAGRNVSGAGAGYRVVTEDYLRALDVRLLAGRYFDASDGNGSERVVIINRRMADEYWPGENPVGKLVRATSQERGLSGATAPWLRIIGVVGDIRHWGPEVDPRPEMYVSWRQVKRGLSLTVIVRGKGQLGLLEAAMRDQLRRVEPQVAADFGSLDGRLASMLVPRQMTMSLLTAFAAIAVVLAGLGVYGVLSFAVAQRTREIAIRGALGATHMQILGMVMRDAVRLTSLGVVVGLGAALALARGLESMLVDVTSSDPLTYGVSATILAISASIAALLPAVQAARLDPAIALKSDA